MMEMRTSRWRTEDEQVDYRHVVVWGGKAGECREQGIEDRENVSKMTSGSVVTRSYVTTGTFPDLIHCISTMIMILFILSGPQVRQALGLCIVASHDTAGRCNYLADGRATFQAV
jgi:hypothetical protein